MSATAAVRTSSSAIGGGGQPLIEKTPKFLHVFFSVVFSNAPANYPTTGDTLDLTAIFGALSLLGYTFPTNCLPEKVEIRSVKTPGAAALFLYNYAPGTTLANGKVQVFTGAAAQSGLAELAAGNYPAGVTGDVVEGELLLPIL